MGVEMLGFTLDPALDTYVDPTTFASITQWIAGIHTVGVLGQAEAGEAKELIQSYTLNYLMVQSSSDWAALRATGVPLLCQVVIEADVTIDWFTYHYAYIQPFVDYFVVTSDTVELTESTLHTLSLIADTYPLLLGFGITKENIGSLLNAPIKGIALKGSHEIRPGYKDFDDLAVILEVLEEE
jgi:phosphoribosylanthranilate isomerase